MADKAGKVRDRAASARLKLQTNLGRAVMWSKGFGSEETQAAYARARELAAKVDDPAERFATYYGQWVNTSMRSGFAAAQDISHIFLRRGYEQRFRARNRHCPPYDRADAASARGTCRCERASG